MVLNLPEIHKKYKQCGGIYVIQSKEMQEKKWLKVGMSFTNIYKRLDSYHNCIPTGFQIHALLLFRNKTKVEKDIIREAERFIMKLLTPADLKGIRIYPTRIEIFKNTVNEVLKALMLAQDKFTHLGLYSDKETIQYDDKLYEVVKVLNEKTDKLLNRTLYHVLWSDGSKTYEPKSVLQGRDKTGDWIVQAFKEYLKK